MYKQASKVHNNKKSLVASKQKKPVTARKLGKKTPLKTAKRSIAATAELKSRVAYQPFIDKLVTPEEAVEAHLNIPTKVNGEWVSPIKRNINLGCSGFTSVGYPKAIPIALCNMAKEQGFEGQVKYNLHIGASTGPELDANMARHKLIARRFPYQLGKDIQTAINTGEIEFADQHLSTYVDRLVGGFYNKDGKGMHDKNLDVAVVEVTEVTPEGYIVPALSVGATPEILYTAQKVILEVNTKLPSCRGLHDITPWQMFGQRQPYNIMSASDRIGEQFIRIDPSRVVAVVESQFPDNTSDVPAPDDTSVKIAQHIVDFLDHEVRRGRLPRNLFPVQSGIGNIANMVIGGLKDGPFEDVTVWSEVVQDEFLPFFESGKLKYASATSIKLSPKGFEHLFANFDYFKERIILRNQAVSNSPGVIQGLGVLGLNTPVEFDIYGNVNSTHVGGRMLNGIGGSNQFANNGQLAFFHAPSTRPTKTDPYGISSIVPKVVDVDSTEHDSQIFVTEQGLADVRGLSPKERAKVIVNTCAHPVYRDQLNDYFDRAYHAGKAKKALHSPHLFNKVYNMLLNLEQNGTMRDPNMWEKTF